MHMHAILHDGNQESLKATDKLALEYWELPNACGAWSVKNIIAHLAAYELMLSDVLSSLLDEHATTPTLSQMFKLGEGWNDDEVAKRQHLNASETLSEYKQNYENNLQILERIPIELATKSGALAWYGADYDLDDFLVYTFYGHNREHAAQINAFCDIVKRAEA